MLKAVTINALFGTNVHEIWSVAKYLHEVLSNPSGLDGARLVDKLARFENKNFKSFASKYAHFFIEPYGDCPILDKYVLKAMAVHLGDRPIRDYVEFFEWFKQLEYDALYCPDEVDQYLWMAGMAQVWNGPDGKYLSKEVKALLTNVNDDPAVKQALAVLM